MAKTLLIAYLLGLVSMVIGVWLIKETYTYRMLFVNRFCFVTALIFSGAAVIERKTNLLGLDLLNNRLVP